MSEYIIDMSNSIYTSQDNLIHFDFSSIHDEIVRCRDCKWYCEEWNRKLMRDTISCDWFDGAHVKPDGFCAWGERKDENGR